MKWWSTLAAVLLIAGVTAAPALAGNQADQKQRAERAKKQQAEAAREKAAAKKQAEQKREQAQEKASRRRTDNAADKAASRAKQDAPVAEKAAAKPDPAKPASMDSTQREQNRQAVVDTRQNFQSKRIEHGVNKGYLTSDEAAQLEAQQAKIAGMEKSFTSDGNLTKSEFASLREELNAASRCIWSQKHDTEGNQMPVYVLGKNVFAKDEITMPLQNELLSRPQALTLLKDLRRTVTLQRTLATADLPADERAKLQAEYNTLLNQYFEVRGAAA